MFNFGRVVRLKVLSKRDVKHEKVGSTWSLHLYMSCLISMLGNSSTVFDIHGNFPWLASFISWQQKKTKKHEKTTRKSKLWRCWSLPPPYMHVYIYINKYIYSVKARIIRLSRVNIRFTCTKGTCATQKIKIKTQCKSPAVMCSWSLGVSNLSNLWKFAGR